MQKNINRIEVVRTQAGLLTRDFRPRAKPLLDLEGWYGVEANNLPIEYQPYMEAFRAAKSNMKATRWIARNHPGLTPTQLTELGKLLSERDSSFKLSCRLQDLVRASETNHFHTCFSEDGRFAAAKFQLLLDPDMAILYIPDSAGKFRWRAFVRLMKVDRKPVLAVYRSYGNGNLTGVLKKLSTLLPVYLFPYNAYRAHPRRVQLEGYSFLTNHHALHLLWSDAKIKSIGKKGWVKLPISIIGGRTVKSDVQRVVEGRFYGEAIPFESEDESFKEYLGWGSIVN